MSHLKERVEKNCLNCNAIVEGKYCTICGQQNIPPQESVWHFITHIFNDITHFDGKFFTSLKYILTKPGFLSLAFLHGRRKSYLDPVRFYLFTSALFFFIVFTFFAKNLDSKSNKDYTQKDSVALAKALQNVEYDSAKIKKLFSKKTLDSLKNTAKSEKNEKDNFFKFSAGDEEDSTENITTLEAFDSIVALGKFKHGLIIKNIARKQLKFSKAYNYDQALVNKATKEIVISLIPKIMFISLPFFALFLQLFYLRRKNYYYVAHAIFSIHFYIFTYINLLLIILLGLVVHVEYLGWVKYIRILLCVYNLYYLYRAMRIYYQQSMGKTIAKYLLIFLSSIILCIFLAIILVSLIILKM